MVKSTMTETVPSQDDIVPVCPAYCNMGKKQWFGISLTHVNVVMINSLCPYVASVRFSPTVWA